MDEIRLSQTQPPSSTSNAVGESSDDPVLMLAAIDERVIANQVLGVWRGHRKGVGRIIKGKRKAPDTSYSIIAFGSSEQTSQVTENHC